MFQITVQQIGKLKEKTKPSQPKPEIGSPKGTIFQFSNEVFTLINTQLQRHNVKRTSFKLQHPQLFSELEEIEEQAESQESSLRNNLRTAKQKMKQPPTIFEENQSMQSFEVSMITPKQKKRRIPSKTSFAPRDDKPSTTQIVEPLSLMVYDLDLQEQQGFCWFKQVKERCRAPLSKFVRVNQRMLISIQQSIKQTYKMIFIKREEELLSVRFNHQVPIISLSSYEDFHSDCLFSITCSVFNLFYPLVWPLQQSHSSLSLALHSQNDSKQTFERNSRFSLLFMLNQTSLMCCFNKLLIGCDGIRYFLKIGEEKLYFSDVKEIVNQLNYVISGKTLEGIFKFGDDELIFKAGKVPIAVRKNQMQVGRLVLKIDLIQIDDIIIRHKSFSAELRETWLIVGPLEIDIESGQIVFNEISLRTSCEQVQIGRREDFRVSLKRKGWLEWQSREVKMQTESIQIDNNLITLSRDLDHFKIYY